MRIAMLSTLFVTARNVALAPRLGLRHGRRNDRIADIYEKVHFASRVIYVHSCPVTPVVRKEAKERRARARVANVIFEGTRRRKKGVPGVKSEVPN